MQGFLHLVKGEDAPATCRKTTAKRLDVMAGFRNSPCG